MNTTNTLHNVNRKKHICFVSQSFYPSPGGVSTMLYNLGKTLVSEGYVVSFIHFGERDSVEEGEGFLNITVGFDRFSKEVIQSYAIFKEFVYKDAHDISSIAMGSITEVEGYTSFQLLNEELRKEISKLHTRHAIDVLHVHDYQVIECARMKDIPVVLFSLHFPVHKNLSSAVMGLLRENTINCKAFIVSTHEYKKILLQKMFTQDETLIVLEPLSGLEYEHVGMYEKILRSCVRWVKGVLPHFLNSEFTILCVQRFDAKSGYLDIIASANLIREYPVKFVFVGEGSLTDKISSVRKSYFKEAKDLVEELGLQDKITFVGNIPYLKLRKYYILSDVFIILSKMECYGLAVTEAMSQGIPIIASDVPGFSHQVIDNYNGFLVDSGDHAYIADKIRELYQNKTKRMLFARNSRRRYSENFSYSVVTQKYLMIYHSFLK